MQQPIGQSKDVPGQYKIYWPAIAFHPPTQSVTYIYIYIYIYICMYVYIRNFA